MATGKQIRGVGGHRRHVDALAFSADGMRLISAGLDDTMRVWNWRSSREETVWQYSKHALFSFSADGRKVAVADYSENRMRIRDLSTHQEEALVPVVHAMRPPAFSPDAGHLAWMDWEYSIHLWDLQARRRLHRIVADNVERDGPSFLAEGKVLAWGERQKHGKGSTIRFLDCITGNIIQSLPASDNISNFAFAPDGKTWATASFEKGSGGNVRLWDVSTLREIGLVGWFDGIPYLHFSPDGRFVALFCLKPDCVRVLEVATGREVRRFDGNQAGIQSIAFSRDHRLLATGGGNSTILVWDLTGRMKGGKFSEARLKHKELESLWAALAGPDAAKAQDAVWALVAAPQDAVAFLQTKLKAIAPVDPGHLDKLIRALDDKTFAVRADATSELAKLGERAEGALRRALKNSPSLEMRQRIERVLAIPKLPLSDPERLQAVRGVQVLEYTATPAARRHLKTLSKGVPEARVTQDARLALTRLGQDKPGRSE